METTVLATRFTELVGCSVPLQQAAMGGGSPRLAAAVSEAGALGMVAAIIYPKDVLADMLDWLRLQTSRSVGVNFLMPFLNRDCVEVAATRARVVEFFYGAPEPSLVQEVHSCGALASWQVGSREEAIAAENAGCDFIVAQGVEAGGHVRGHIGLMVLLTEVLDLVQVPVLAAGGIGTGRAMAAALAAGASGVRVGTRFVAAEEAEYHPFYVDALAAASGQDTILTETFSAMWPDAPHRVLRSAVEAVERFEGEVVGETSLGGVKMPVPRFSSGPPTRETTGAVEAMALYAGESVGAVRGAQPAASIVRELADEAERLLRRWS